MIEDNLPKTEDIEDTPDAVIEHCPKCSTLLDVTGCHPLMETACPSCGALIKVLREFHHFVLLSEIGRGGSGAVYRAFDETLERDVALKLLRNEHTNDAAYLASLETEALITASINHSHVVKVFSTGRKSGYYYIAMEIVGGGSVADRIDRNGRLHEKAVLSLGIQAAQGLHAAYQRGLLHRDVKPGNILFSDDQSVKVVDFGLAIPLEQAKGDSADIWGTPDYIAPEKLLQEGEDHRSDIYSLGCTLFHCLTGCPPFETKTIQMLIHSHTELPAPNVQTLASDISGATAFVIQRCLEKKPAARYQSYPELIEHLQYALDQLAPPQPAVAGARAQARSAAAPAAGPKWKPPFWMYVAGGVVLLALICGLLLVRHRSGDNAPVPPDISVAKSSGTPAAQTAAAQRPAEKPAEYRIVDLRSAYTGDTRVGLFQDRRPDDTLAFPQYGIIKANGIPFELVDPARNPSGFNVIILNWWKTHNVKKTEIKLSSLPVRKFHILGGIAGFGWAPDHNSGLNAPLVRFTVFHPKGEKEEFIFKNGIEFANHPKRVDVPGSKFADGVTNNGHQVRTFSVVLANPGPVDRVLIEDIHDNIQPVFVAITAELAER